MLDHLKKLAAHIESLDSGSKDAAAIYWAIDEIKCLNDILLSVRVKLENALEDIMADVGREGNSGSNHDALYAMRYRYLRDKGLIFFQKTGSEVDGMVDAMMQGK